MNKPLLLVVEDDVTVRNLISTALKANDYRYLTAPNGETALSHAAASQPDIILLDLGLPDLDGVEVIRRIRSWSLMPIIVISARSEDADKIAALDAGADDYLTKPFGIMELISRVKAQLRRVPGSASLSPLLSCGSLTLNPATREVFCGQEPITLTYKEFELLELLMQHPGQVLSRNIIMDRVWGYDFEGTSRTLDMHIRTLRQKLGEQGKMVQTIRNVGYKLECSS